MSAPLDWRRIEAALIECAKRHNWDTYRYGRTGDAFAEHKVHTVDINLTLLAQDLAKELEQ